MEVDTAAFKGAQDRSVVGKERASHSRFTSNMIRRPNSKTRSKCSGPTLFDGLQLNLWAICDHGRKKRKKLAFSGVVSSPFR